MNVDLENSDPLAQAIVANRSQDVITFIGTRAYRLEVWMLKADCLTTEWVDESDALRARTMPWQWRLRWKLRNLVRKVI